MRGPSLVAQMANRLPAVQETWVQSLGQEGPLEKGGGYPFQYSFLENSMDRGAWQAAVHGVAKMTPIPQMIMRTKFENCHHQTAPRSDKLSVLIISDHRPIMRLLSFRGLLHHTKLPFPFPISFSFKIFHFEICYFKIGNVL